MGSAAWSKTHHQEIQQPTDESITEDIVDQQLFQNIQEKEEDTIEKRQSRYKKEMDNFKDFLEQKRLERQETISRLSEEIQQLRESKDDLEKERILRMGLEKQVGALKEVSVVTNEMLQLREIQVVQLKQRIQNMETVAEENLTTLRSKYEIQIENMRNLRQLYEERAEASTRGHEIELEKERAKNVLLELKLDEYSRDATTKQKLTQKIEELENQLSASQAEVEELKTERSSLEAQCSNLTAQLSIINNLFSNMLTGDMNFDLLTRLLQDNHNLIIDLIANGDINDTAALLVNIAQKTYKKSIETEEGGESSAVTTPLGTKEEIASNLPKVWRMLIELLSSHEDCPPVPGTHEECYKHVTTPSGGSRTVISVSQTFLRLKDLIIEKNSLVKEVSRLKTLNGHLENRLDLQEKRLSVVSSELRKTWGIVSKLKVQHRQLHTNEKVLRYELQHKRQMLNELKNELEYCKETWDKAREKNTQTEHDWELLRKEFALRKSRDASNSAESGYEDDETSQDISASELEYDISPMSDSQKAEFELEDAASDATVIELMDMLDLDADEPPQDTAECSEESITVYEAQMVDSCDPVTAEENPRPAATETTKNRSSEEILDRRSARLKRLEQQCQSLLNQMALTSLRSDTLSTRLEELHEQYGSEESRRSLLARQSTEKENVELADAAVESEIQVPAIDVACSEPANEPSQRLSANESAEASEAESA